MPVAPGTVLDLTSARYAQLEASAINAWVRGQAFTQRALVEAIERPDGTGMPAGNATYYLGQLARRGQYVSQPARFGAKGSGYSAGRPTSPQIFNLGRVAVAGATLRTAVEPYLQDSAVVESRKHALRSALRFFLELPEQCPEDRILVACESLPASRLYGLPRQVREAALAAVPPLKKQTAKNHALAVAQAMRHAAESRSIPLIFPHCVAQDAWARTLQRAWPLATKGRTAEQTLADRRAWYAYAEAAKTLLGEERTPESVTRREAEDVVAYMKRNGKIAVAGTVLTMLRRLAETRAEGPFAPASSLDPFLVPTSHGRRSAIMLRGGGPGWDGLIDCLRLNGFPEETITFLEWYALYITLPPTELLIWRREYPRRLNSHRLGIAALDGRAQALRAFLGAAVHELELDPMTLTPANAFGYQFDAIAGALIGWWERRRNALEEGAVGSAKAGSVHKYIIGAGMMAFTLFEKLTFERGIQVAQRKSQSGQSQLVDRRAVHGSGKTDDEQAAWNAYVSSDATGELLKGAAMERLAVSTKGAVPELRNIHRILADTGPEWWVALLNGLIARVRAAKRNKTDNTLAYHRLVQTTFEVGFYISTGCRNEEGCIIRMDRHYQPELAAKREVALSGRDRKNKKETRVRLHTDYVPDDVLDEYLSRTRPYFMTANHIRKGRHPVPDHPFLFVNERGKPYGYLYEEMDAAIAAVIVAPMPGEEPVGMAQRRATAQRRVRERFERAFRYRANAHGERIKRAMVRYATEFHLARSGRKYEFGLHPLRISCGFAIYLLEGIGAAAAYLGDTENTVKESYSAISGINVDSRCLLSAAKSAATEYERRNTRTVPAAEGTDSGSSDAPLGRAGGMIRARTKRHHADALRELLEAKRRGDIDEDEFALLKSALRAERSAAPNLQRAV